MHGLRYLYHPRKRNIGLATRSVQRNAYAAAGLCINIQMQLQETRRESGIKLQDEVQDILFHTWL